MTLEKAYKWAAVVGAGVALRMPLVMLGTILALAIVAVGSYYGFFAPDGGVDRPRLPSFAEGAENVVVTHVFWVQPDDYSKEFGRSDVVVEGVIKDLLHTKWTTSDSVAPDEITPAIVMDLDTHIRTTALLKVEKVFKGNDIGDTLNFSFMGGRVGNTAHVFEGHEDFQKGARVILFLAAEEPGSPAKMVDEQGLSPRMHLIVENGSIQGPLREVDRATLMKQINPDSK